MIPNRDVTAWATNHPWPTPEQVEQDLLLSQAICVIAHDDYLSRELVFRGGTALHKLHLDQPYRYSEDLDYVRQTATGIGQLARALCDLGTGLGYDASTRMGQHPKIYWKTTAATGVPLRIKIEINTHERSPALPIITKQHRVESAWWAGDAAVRTFQAPELVATKIRALYQRSKGRDLFDLWLALEHMQLPAQEILAAFGPYRPEGLTADRARANLAGKLADPAFREDLTPLVAAWAPGYTPDVAAACIIKQLINRLDDQTPTKEP